MGAPEKQNARKGRMTVASAVVIAEPGLFGSQRSSARRSIAAFGIRPKAPPIGREAFGHVDDLVTQVTARV